LIIGVLFISISATVSPQSLRHLLLPTLGLTAVLVVVARPLAAFVSTLRTDLGKGERAFVGWMAPRGIVAVYRLAPQARSHGVVAPYTGGRILFGDGMTRPAVCGRYDDGARIMAQPANGVPRAGHDVLFLVRADGQLAAVTQTGTMVAQDGDTVVSLGPVPVASSPVAG
jgi:hypothetical protein